MADVQEAFIRFMFDLGRGVDMDRGDKIDRVNLLKISDNGKRSGQGFCACAGEHAVHARAAGRRRTRDLTSRRGPGGQKHSNNILAFQQHSRRQLRGRPRHGLVDGGDGDHEFLEYIVFHVVF